MSHVNPDECKAAGLDVKAVARIARGISRYAKQARSMGVEVFGGGGSGTLRFRDSLTKGALVVAHLDGRFDGGAGDEMDFGDGLLRAEIDR